MLTYKVRRRLLRLIPRSLAPAAQEYRFQALVDAWEARHCFPAQPPELPPIVL